jgi:1,4-alpha-glucan branching enzyme
VSLAGDNSGSWQEVFNSQAPVYGGVGTVGNFGATLSPAQGELWINLPSWGVLVFAKQ